jgi:RNA polymerase sigma-70 factor, ECF subfamily
MTPICQSETSARKASDPLEFARLVEKNQAMVFSIALRFLRDRGAAEEIAQEVFLKLYRSIGELTSEAHATFWLRKVTSRRCIDYVRHRKLRVTVALDDAPEPSTTEVPGDFLVNERLRKLMRSLPEKPRLVMILRYQEDLPPEEIARILDMPVRTVKSHLQRSIAILREKFGRLTGVQK